MIASFGDKATEDLYNGLRSKRVRHIPSDVWRTAIRKLDMIQYAEILDDLKVPPGNRLEALKGNRRSYYSIRINQRWRVLFRWNNGMAYDVSVVDYHSG